MIICFLSGLVSTWLVLLFCARSIGLGVGVGVLMTSGLGCGLGLVSEGLGKGERVEFGLGVALGGILLNWRGLASPKIKFDSCSFILNQLKFFD